MNRVINPKREDWPEMLKRPTQTVADIEKIGESIFEEVRTNGDKAIKKYTDQFDRVQLDTFLVTAEEIKEASDSVPTELKKAISLAKSNIEKFHAAQKTTRVAMETMPGVECWQEKRPIQKVGLYIPG